jgi:hypothetical protein
LFFGEAESCIFQGVLDKIALMKALLPRCTWLFLGAESCIFQGVLDKIGLMKAILPRCTWLFLGAESCIFSRCLRENVCTSACGSENALNPN